MGLRFSPTTNDVAYVVVLKGIKYNYTVNLLFN